MTSDTSFYMETVSLHDDESISSINDDLEGQIKLSERKYASSTPIMIDLEEEEEGGDNNENTEQVAVVVDHQEKVVKTSSPPPTLPPLRLKEIQQEYDHDERDYVDTSLFSPEVTRHSLELAHRRARALENELRELEALEQMHTSPVTSSVVKITPLEAVAIISTAFTGSVSKMKQFLHGQNVEYNLLTGTSPLNKVDDLDTDGDGLQLSPDASRGNDGKHFIPSPKIKPALKRISVYSQLGKDHKRSNRQAPHTRRRLQWHEDVLDHDEEFIDEEGEAFEEESLMINGGDKKTLLRQSTPRSKKKRKKLVRSIMRRLTPYEKEELYKERPDLMIVPNWAQKYREEMTESESTRWSVWLMIIIGTLALLLLILIMLIARDQSVKTQVT